MTAHDRMRVLLADRARLNPMEQQQLDEHLRSCLECQMVATEYRRQDRFMQGLPLPEPAGLRGRVLAGIAASTVPTRSTRRLLMPVLTPLLILVLLVTSVALPQTRLMPVAALGYGPQYQEGIPSNGLNAFGRLQGMPPNVDGARGDSLSRVEYGPAVLDSAAAAKSAAPEGTGPPPMVSSTHTAHGIQISLLVWLPEWHTPRHALLGASLVVRNVSRRPITLSGGMAPCAAGESVIQVLDAQGNVLSPPPMPGFPVTLPLCATTPQRPLAPGHVQGRHYLLYLDGPRARAQVMTITNTVIRTPAVRIPTVAATPPDLHLQLTPGMAVRVTGLVPDGGPLFAAQTWTCGGVSGTGSGSQAAVPGPRHFDDPYWEAIQGTTIRPGCAHPSRWHLLVGQIGHSAASYTYIAGRR